MKKIPTIFQRDQDNRKLVTQEINPDCYWVFEGEGYPTRKYDGTCCKIEHGTFWKRREINFFGDWPDNFYPISTDDITGKTVGWIPVEVSSENKWHLEAFNYAYGEYPDGTYELVGPKIQGNPENYETHRLIKHSDATRYHSVIRSYDGIKEFLSNLDIEGLVFHHPDGRMAKIKKRDFYYE